jgi:peroxiredoxin family protein
MTMDIMGIKSEELIEGIEEGGVAYYLDKAEAGNVNLFI